MTELDSEIRAAFKALSETVQEDYFDDFESRLQARLEEDAMTDIAEDQTGASQTSDDSQVSIAAMAADRAVPPARADDNSGLHDIRALAAKTKERVSQRKSAERPDEPVISSVSLALKAISLPEPGKDFKFYAGEDAPVSAAAAVAAPEQDSGLPTWIYAAMSAVAAAALVFFLFRGDKRGEPTPPAENERTSARAGLVNPSNLPSESPISPTPNPAVANAPTAADVSATRTVAGSDLAIGAADPAGVAPSPDAKSDGVVPGGVPHDAKSKVAKTTTKRSTARKGNPSKAKKASSAEKSEQAPATSKRESNKPKKKKPDTLEELLNAAGGDSGTSKKADKKKPTAASKPTRTKLDSNDVKQAIGKLKGKTQACYDKYKEPGLVSVKFSVAPSGKVTTAAAKGKFKGTDTGNCVASAVKTAKFPAFNGAPMTFTFPVFLSQ